MEFLVSVICNGFLKLRRRYVPDCRGTHVARIVDSINGKFDSGIAQPVGVTDHKVLRTRIAVMDQESSL